MRKEVARLAGVSEATVSRVLNNVGPIKPETRDRVLKAAKELGYVPNALAQRLARRKSGNIGVIVPMVPKVHLFSTYYFAEILSGIGDAAKQCDYDLLLIFREMDGPRDYAKLFRTQKVDACVVLGAQDVPEEKEALAALRDGGYPFCLVNQRFPEEGFLSVDADHRRGSFEAVMHLIEEGRKHIAFLNGPEVYSNSKDRLEGYVKALEQSGQPLEEELLFLGNYSRKSGHEAAGRVAELYQAGKIDAVFAANDRMAIGLMDGLRDYGFEAGKQLAIVGYDDSDSSRIVSPKLSTVSVPFYEMGRAAAMRLLAPQTEKEAMLEHEYLLPVQFVHRETS
ncbi:LacI family DNA-binding transcriptional regulator [Paenibacillus sp. NEAU-GSW1]|uniref:LacI family DNA-binding transcriptional regulator n=1 Tax=Paenibacillus sp. NEAU-GSW1 TaxID=2682486 RepID=UPI00139EE3BA|nr:LacI family DNA-binding transcriptional regulator [Paenibacillus sp. NEAU-GSW1]